MVEDSSSNSTKQLNPYLFMAVLYLLLGILAAIQSMLLLWELLDSNHTTAWVRIHFITIGVMTQFIIGYLPRIVNKSSKTRWDIWFLLNVGLFTFFYGRSLLRNDLMITGGTFLLIALSLFVAQLISLRDSNSFTVWYYITGSAFLIIGIIMGMSIWNDWGDYLGVVKVLEVHIHANNWGFMTLVFSGLMYDILPKVFDIDIHWPTSIKKIFVIQALGATGLVAGPWIDYLPLNIIGMILFLVGTLFHLLNFILPMREKKKTVGYYHIISAYIWIAIPLLFAPFVILKTAGFEYIEVLAPQALIYGWVLQVGFAFLYYFLSQILGKNNGLGGCWGSLILVNLGAIMLWVSIFTRSIRTELHGVAYGLWALSIIPIFVQNYKLLREA